MSLDQSLDQSSCGQIPDESRDDRILEALAQFRHDVMKEIFLIKEALKESLIGGPESPCPSELKKVSLVNRNDTDHQMGYEVIKEIEKQSLYKPSWRNRNDEDHDSLKLEFVECFPGHSIKSPSPLDLHYEQTNSSLDTSLTSNRDAKTSKVFFGAASQAALIPSLKLSKERIGTSLNSDSDVLSFRSSLSKLSSKASDANDSVQREQLDSYIIASSEKEQKDCRDFVKEELCSDSAKLHDPFPHQIPSAFPSSSRQSHVLSADSPHHIGANLDRNSDSLDLMPRLPYSYSQNIHGWVKSFTCEICHRHFGNSSNLKVHMRVHTREKPYKCEHCGKRFTTTSNLKVHIRTHTGERPYKCTHCHKAFINHSNLKTHSQIHIVQRDYACGIRGENYSFPTQLKAQMNEGDN